MKNMISLVFAGIMGGAAALGGAYILQESNSNDDAVAATPAAESSNNQVMRLASNTGMQGAPTDFTQAAAQAMPSVVHIKSLKVAKPRTAREYRYYQYFGQPAPSESTGSGVIISPKGYIVTNNHVVENASEVEVTLYDKRSFKAEVVGLDPTTDLAVLKVPEETLQAIQLADSDEARVGDWVLAVGNPFNLTSTATAGIISAKGRNLSILEGQYSIESFIQTDAAVNPGNSGGALVDMNGNLVGINTAIATPTGTYAGYSFAVPINLVKKVVQDLIDYGEVHRGFLGIMIADIDATIAKRYDLAVSEGVLVSSVLEEGSAEEAGLKAGDVIISVAGRTVRSSAELQEQIGSRSPGDTVRVGILRDGKEKTLQVKLSE